MTVESIDRTHKKNNEKYMPLFTHQVGYPQEIHTTATPHKKTPFGRLSSHELLLLVAQKVAAITNRSVHPIAYLCDGRFCFDKITQNFLCCPSSLEINWVAQHMSMS